MALVEFPLFIRKVSLQTLRMRALLRCGCWKGRLQANWFNSRKLKSQDRILFGGFLHESEFAFANRIQEVEGRFQAYMWSGNPRKAMAKRTMLFRVGGHPNLGIKMTPTCSLSTLSDADGLSEYGESTRSAFTWLSGQYEPSSAGAKSQLMFRPC